jgi:hypothetical protein
LDTVIGDIEALDWYQGVGLAPLAAMDADRAARSGQCGAYGAENF